MQSSSRLRNRSRSRFSDALASSKWDRSSCSGVGGAVKLFIGRCTVQRFGYCGKSPAKRVNSLASEIGSCLWSYGSEAQATLSPTRRADGVYFDRPTTVHGKSVLFMLPQVLGKPMARKIRLRSGWSVAVVCGFGRGNKITRDLFGQKTIVGTSRLSESIRSRDTAMRGERCRCVPVPFVAVLDSSVTSNVPTMPTQRTPKLRLSNIHSPSVSSRRHDSSIESCRQTSRSALADEPVDQIVSYQTSEPSVSASASRVNSSPDCSISTPIQNGRSYFREPTASRLLEGTAVRRRGRKDRAPSVSMPRLGLLSMSWF